ARVAGGGLGRSGCGDAPRRYRVDVSALDEQLPNWRPLLERFAEERAPVYLRRDAEVTTALRRLHAAGLRVGVFADGPAELTTIALSHLGADRRVDLVESGEGARDRGLTALGGGAGRRQT